MITIALSL